MHEEQQDISRGLVWGFVGVLIFSVSLPLTRVAVAELDPVFVGMARGMIAAVLSLIALLSTKSPLLNRQQLVQVIITATGVTIGFPLFSSLAMQQVPAGHGAVVNGLLPLATVALGAVVMRYTLRWQFWLAAIVGSATAVGVVIWRSGSGIVPGDVAMIVAVLIAAVGYVYGGRLSAQIGGWRTICWANVVSIPVMLWPTYAYAPVHAVSSSAWLALAYLGVFSMFLGFFAWYHGLALGGIPRVSQVQLIQPFLTIVWAWPLTGEHPTIEVVVAAAIVVTCIWIARRNSA